MLLVSVFVLLALPLIEALQSDRLLPREYYESIYKNKYDADLKIGDRTPWDIGNNRPQPAVVRAYNEGKIRGNILDAGCGVGENCIYLADKYGIKSITGFDLSEDAVHIATNNVGSIIERQTQQEQQQSPFWTTPKFLAASCTNVADRHRKSLLSSIIVDDRIVNDDGDDDDKLLFDVIIDSGLLHCLSEEDASDYVNQISKLLRPNTGRFLIGCFSDKNPDPWDNPRRISEDYLRNVLFSREKWDVVSCADCWWQRPSSRGSSTGGAFSLALWVEVRRLS